MVATREPLIIFTGEEVETLDIKTLQNYAWSWTQSLGYGETALKWIKSASQEDLKTFCINRSPSEKKGNKESCPHFIAPTMERRPSNALNFEISQPASRCALKTPWPDMDAARWLYSRGSPLVLGCCDSLCPKSV